MWQRLSLLLQQLLLLLQLLPPLLLLLLQLLPFPLLQLQLQLPLLLLQLQLPLQLRLGRVRGRVALVIRPNGRRRCGRERLTPLGGVLRQRHARGRPLGRRCGRDRGRQRERRWCRRRRQRRQRRGRAVHPRRRRRRRVVVQRCGGRGASGARDYTRDYTRERGKGSGGGGEEGRTEGGSLALHLAFARLARRPEAREFGRRAVKLPAREVRFVREVRVALEQPPSLVVDADGAHGARPLMQRRRQPRCLGRVQQRTQSPGDHLPPVLLGRKPRALRRRLGKALPERRRGVVDLLAQRSDLGLALRECGLALRKRTLKPLALHLFEPRLLIAPSLQLLVSLARLVDLLAQLTDHLAAVARGRDLLAHHGELTQQRLRNVGRGGRERRLLPCGPRVREGESASRAQARAQSRRSDDRARLL